jgi:hypothetical protein
MLISFYVLISGANLRCHNQLEKVWVAFFGRRFFKYEFMALQGIIPIVMTVPV